MGTERTIALSGKVAGAAAKKLGITVKQALKQVAVAVPVDAMGLQFSYTASTAQDAWKGARAFTYTYAAVRNASMKSTSGTGAKGKAAGGIGGGKANAKAGAGLGTGNGKQTRIVWVVTRPNVPGVADAANLPLVLGLSIILGGMVGLGAALLWDRSSDRLRGALDVGEQTGLPVLASVPTFTEPLTLSLSAYTSVAAREVYGHLATQLPKLLDARWGVSVLVTSPSRGAGKSTTAAQLAASLALLGKDVVLVEADVRNPVLEDWFWLPPGPGLNEVLASKVPLERALRGTDYEHLQVLTAGAPTAAESVTFDLEDMQLLIGRLARGALVIVDAPTCTEAAETAQLAVKVDQVLLVCDVRRGLRADARAAVVALSHVRDKITGCVANRPMAGRSHGRARATTWRQETAGSPAVSGTPGAPSGKAPAPPAPSSTPSSASTDK
ncbi:MAG: nucleotide-binding protein [Nocardioidaceae bacterium]